MMHADELPIDEPLVRRLLAEQFPQWAELALTRIEPSGTVNAIYRLGDELAVRLPRLPEWSPEVDHEGEWLPRLAPHLPLEIPVPAAHGRPGAGYPCHWSVVTWLDGQVGTDGAWDPLEAARDLAGFVRALQAVDATGAPQGRGVSLAERDARIRWAFEQLADPRLDGAWERALAAPAWEGPPVWHHGDLDARNWLVRDGRITGIIDWGGLGAGDPAVEVMVAWKLHSPDAALAFRQELGVDDATWERARGWAVSQAAAALAYYTPENNPTLVHEARLWLELALRSE